MGVFSRPFCELTRHNIRIYAECAIFHLCIPLAPFNVEFDVSDVRFFSVGLKGMVQFLDDRFDLR